MGGGAHKTTCMQILIWQVPCCAKAFTYHGFCGRWYNLHSSAVLQLMNIRLPSSLLPSCCPRYGIHDWYWWYCTFVGIHLPHQPTTRSNNNRSRLPLFAYPEGQQSFTIPDLTTSSDLVVQYSPSSSRKRASNVTDPSRMYYLSPPVPTFLAPTLAVGLFSRVQYST